MKQILVSLLVVLLLFLCATPLVAEEIGEDILSYMMHLREELLEEYHLWLQSRILYETSKRYHRSVSDVLHLYQEIFLEESSSQNREESLKLLGFEEKNGDWYYEGEKMVTHGRLFSSEDAVKAYRDIHFGDSKEVVRQKLKDDLGYSHEALRPVIQIAGEPFVLSFSFYEDSLYQILIQHKETRFTEDIFKFSDGVKYQDILYQVIYSQYGEPSFSQEVTLSSLEPPYESRAEWSSIWGPEKTGGKKEIRIGISYISLKGTLLIEYLPIVAEREGIVYVQDNQEEELEDTGSIRDAGQDF